MTNKKLPHHQLQVFLDVLWWDIAECFLIVNVLMGLQNFTDYDIILIKFKTHIHPKMHALQ